MQNIIVAVAMIAILFLSFASYYQPKGQATQASLTGYVILPYESNLNQSSNYVVKKTEGLKESTEQVISR